MTTHIENSDRGITITKGLAWTILVGLVGLSFYMGTTLAGLGTKADNLASVVDQLNKDRITFRAEVRSELADAERARDAFTDRLRVLVGAATSVRFADDPTLLAGAELHFPHTVLHHSWRDSLREIEEELKRDGRPAGLA